MQTLISSGENTKTYLFESSSIYSNASLTFKDGFLYHKGYPAILLHSSLLAPTFVRKKPKNRSSHSKSGAPDVMLP